MTESYDLVIIGSGPAGLAAGLYGVRARLNTLMLEKESFGGQVGNLDLVENYPGFPEGILGAELQALMVKQAKKFGLRLKMGEVTGIRQQGDVQMVKAGPVEYAARTVIIAGGAHPRKLGIPGEAEFEGRGVIYCAVCEGGLFRGKPVAVAGGGDASLSGALYMAKQECSVTVIARASQLRATRILQERVAANPQIKVLYGAKIESVSGNDHVTGLKLRNSSGEASVLDVNALLVEIGRDPNTGYLNSALALDKDGYIVVDAEMRTSVPGIFAAGDIRQGLVKQIATAIGDGARAALAAHRYLTSGS